MSLINDALKRAHKKADQPRPSPVDGLALRPPGPVASARHSEWLIPAIIGLSVALMTIAVVIFNQARGSKGSTPSPETLTAKAREASPAATPAATAQTAAPVETAKTPAPAMTNTPLAITPAAAPVAAAVAESTAPVAPPQPEPLRLQAIIHSPTRPSAIISGKSVFVGERVQGIKVVNITKDTVTLANNGKNLVLTLPE